MGVIVPFPTVEPVTCGRWQDVPVHIWAQGCQPGDRCVCGQSILRAELASKMLITELSSSAMRPSDLTA